MEKSYFRDNKAFTLIELSIVVVITSLILGAVLSVAKPYFVEKQRDRTTSGVRSVERAMAQFFADNGRYPCPASLVTARSTAADGAEDCDSATAGIYQVDGFDWSGAAVPGGVLVGAVPYRALEIPVDATIDAFQNRLTYAVSTNSANTGYSDQYVWDPGTGTMTVASSATIRVLDDSGTSISARDINQDGVDDQLPVHYYFFSHGQDGKGAHTNDGVLYGSGCTSGAADSENCDFLTGTPDGIFVTLAQSHGTGATYSDDVSNYSLLVEADLNDSLWARTPGDDENIYNLNNNNVGVGTIDPRRTFHVNGSARIGGDAYIDATEPNGEGAFQAASPLTGEGFLEVPWLYTDGCIEGDRRGTSATALCIGGDDFGTFNGYTQADEIALVTNGESRVFIHDDLVGVGTENPLGTLHVIMDTNEPLIAEWFGTIGNPNNGAHLQLKSNRGTETIPEQVRQNDALGVLSFGSRGDSSDPNGFSASIVALAAQDFTGNARGADLSFRTVPLNGVTAHAKEWMRITHGGYVGIGRTDPQRTLDVRGGMRVENPLGSDWWTSIGLFNYTNSQKHSGFIAHKARGTHSSPSGARPGDLIGVFEGRGDPAIVNPGNPHFGAGMRITASEQHASGRMGSDLHFATVSNGRNSSDVRMTIKQDGKVGIGVANPVKPLEVRGDVEVHGKIRLNSTGMIYGNTCTRPEAGTMRYNDPLSSMQFCDGVIWKSMSGGAGFAASDILTLEIVAPARDWQSCPANHVLVSCDLRYGFQHGGTVFMTRTECKGKNDGRPITFNMTCLRTGP